MAKVETDGLVGTTVNGRRKDDREAGRKTKVDTHHAASIRVEGAGSSEEYRRGAQETVRELGQLAKALGPSVALSWSILADEFNRRR